MRRQAYDVIALNAMLTVTVALWSLLRSWLALEIGMPATWRLGCGCGKTHAVRHASALR